MAFARLNGYTLALEAGRGLDVDTFPIGEPERTISGSMIGTVRANKLRFNLTTTLTDRTLSDSIRNLITGVGDVWHFDDSASTDWQWIVNGLGAASGTGDGSSLASGKFGRGLRIAATKQVTWTTNTGSVWTVMVWYYTGGAWVHYIVRSDGGKCVDGVRNDGATTTFIANTATTTALGDVASGGNQDFDDLVVLPYLLHADIAVEFGAPIAAFSDLPNLVITGDILIADDAEVRKIGDVRTTQMQTATGVYTQHGFTLEEV